MKSNSISRRKFTKLSSAGLGSLLVGLYFPTPSAAATFVKGPETIANGIELNAWIRIDQDGKVTLFTHRAEMGQGVYQSIPQILAEELEVNLDNVNILVAEGNTEKYGNQVTGGSTSIRGSYKNLLRLGATARTLLVLSASQMWGVPSAECYALEGHVHHRSTHRKFHYGELVQLASQLKTPTNIPLKPRSSYQLIGQSVPRKDIPLKVNGSAVFGLDKTIPGMLYAMVERSPKLHGTVKGFDDRETRKIPGVLDVFKIRSGVFTFYREGVAVVADSTWAALQGKRALKIDWDDSGFEHLGSDTIYERMDMALQRTDGLVDKSIGDPDTIFTQTESTIDCTYHTPFQSHSPIEPLNCVAHYHGDKIEIWGPIQAPEWIQDYLSKEMDIKRENIHVNITFLGGAFGRKAFMDYPHEAVLISKQVGKPVQVVWTREDETTQGPWRPAISYRCEAVLEKKGIKALRVRFVGQNQDHMTLGKDADRTKPNWGTSEGFPKPYFDTIPNVSFLDIPFELPTIPIIWWRSVYASTNGFAYDCFLDELAYKLAIDPMDFRRKYLQDHRSQALIDRLEEVSLWKSRALGTGYGMAITECFGTTVGQVVKISKGNKESGVTIDQVWAVVDCGWYVNPNIIKAQIEGSIIMAIGAAAIHEISFEQGKTVQRNFDNYPLPRIKDTPNIEVFIMENSEEAGGVGEAGLPPLAPALANAIFDLTGKRIRKLPIDLSSI